VICFDEIEKAHPEVWNILLQIMEAGHLTDARGRKVDFRNTILIMTSNIGAELIRRETSLGFALPQSAHERLGGDYDRMKSKVLGELKKTFRPEFLNRIDGVIVFHALSKDHVKQICELMLDRLRAQLSERGLTLQLTEAAKSLLAERGYDAHSGARQLRREIQILIEDPLSEQILAGTYHPGTSVLVDRSGDDLVFSPDTSPSSSAGDGSEERQSIQHPLPALG
jgi:ATP-dependent Clp protease ATP-binding subunit ClpC